VAAGSVYYLKLTGFAVGGWMMARSALAATTQLAAGQGEADFLNAKRITARFYADHLLPQADALAEVVVSGGASVTAAQEAIF
jgi:acyl-CoA dehydrogenase